MTETNPPAGIDRIPLAHSVRYVARGLPAVPNQYGRGVLAPSEITLTYPAAEDSQLGRVHAYVEGRLWVDGVEIPLTSGGLYGQHYDDGLSNWPAWLAEEVRLHDPDAATVPASAPTDWNDGHPQLEAIAAAVWERCGRSDSGSCVEDDPRNIAVAALAAVLPALADRAAIRAAALRDAATRYATLADQNEAYDREQGDLDEAARIQHGAVRDVAIGLRGMADEIDAASGPGRVAGETQQPETQAAEWCKCPSCWGWFVEDHSGEDLDELGKDLGWWSGLPVHRDAPAAVSQPGKEPSS